MKPIKFDTAEIYYKLGWSNDILGRRGGTPNRYVWRDWYKKNYMIFYSLIKLYGYHDIYREIIKKYFH